MSVYDAVIEMNGFKFVRLRTGRLLTFWDCLAQARSGRSTLSTGVSRAFKTAREDYDLETLEWLLDDVESYVIHVRQEIEKRRGIKSKQDRIALLRNTTGRTPEEAEAFHRKADELEAELEAERASC